MQPEANMGTAMDATGPPPAEETSFAPSQDSSSLFGSPPRSELNGSSMDFVPTGNPNGMYEQYSMDPTYLPIFPDPTAPNAMPAGPALPYTFNFLMRPDHAGAEVYSLFASQSRLDRVEATLGQVQADLSRLMERVNQQEKERSRDSQLNDSLETIKKGLDKFFTRYASHFEEGECVGPPTNDIM